MAEPSLRAAFLGALSDSRRAEASADAGLDEQLRRWLDDSRRAWAPLAVSGERFVAHVAVHLRDDGPLDAALAAVRATDLYIACACELGDNAAIRTFER